jgi:isoleucyl-tRNA synthetase
MPGTHHIEARTFKDVFPRYRTMKGHHVLRRGGWDCHGLPVELEVEKELGLASKSEIEAYGIDEFNARCRQSVLRYVDAWEELTARVGYWVDLDAAYWTMDPSYVDSVWWALSQLWDRDLLFEDHRVSPYCGRCGTALSDAEVAQGYADVTDASVFVRFPITDGPLAAEGAALLVWTTTPWTLPANTAVAIGPDIAYELVATEAGPVVVAAALRVAAVGDEATVIRSVSVAELLGVRYRGPFDFAFTEEQLAASRLVVTGDFVTTSDGSGLVHIAPAFGADDMEIGRREQLPVVNPVDLDAKFASGPWQGRFVRDADPDIIEDLRSQGLLHRVQQFEHSYPFCWRCKTALIYYAKPSWYIRTTAVRERLIANNATIDWHPEHIRDGRFGNWLENNVDWALSRDRYWGTPLPFWRCGDCNHVSVVSSRADLSERAGQDVSDIDPHRPQIDAVTLPCPECGGESRRVREVADAWLDSGAMPFAQWGYPHQGVEEFNAHFPADYICEAIDQTRGWFYTLLAESTLLFDTSSYRTVLCLGHIVDEDGKKMSKSLGNILDPIELLDAHGADAVRWLMLSDGNPWGPRRVGHGAVEAVVRRLFLTLWNTHSFFCTYANIDGFDPAAAAVPAVADRPTVDQWLLAELAHTIDSVDAALDGFDTSGACRFVEEFIDALSNWYVRLNRRRFWKGTAEDPADGIAAYATLHTALVTVARLMAPMAPFVADQLWEDLVRSQDPNALASVHLDDFPVADPAWHNEELRTAMGLARRVVEVGRQARSEAGMKNRQPLAAAIVSVAGTARAAVSTLVGLIGAELNIRSVEVHDGSEATVTEHKLNPVFKVLGPTFGPDANAVGTALKTASAERITELVTALGAGPATFELPDGRSAEITAEMVDVLETPRTGWQLGSDGVVQVAIDTTLTPELELEGAARQLSRAVNNARRDAGLAVTDRITLRIRVAEDLDRQLADAGWFDWLSSEVLAASLDRTTAPLEPGTAVDLGELGSVTIAIARV